MSVVETLTAPQPGQVAALPVDQVHPADDNVRDGVGDVSGLAASIKSRGLLQPITVYPDGDGWTIIAGHRRHAAHLEAGLDTIDAIIREGPNVDPDELTADRMVENLQRQDLPIADEARGYARLSELRWSQRKIADNVGVTQGQVSKRIKLASLPPEVLAQVGGDDLTVEAALDLVTLYELDPDTAAGLVRGKRWRWVDRELMFARRKVKRAKVIEEVRAAAKDGGPRLHKASLDDNPPWSTLSVSGVTDADHFQFRDAGIDRDRMLSDNVLAVVVTADGEAVEVCTDPHRYFPKAKQPKARRRPWDIATERRRAFIDAWLSSDDHDPPPAHEALVQILVDVALPSMNGTQLQQVTEAVGIDMIKSAGYSSRLGALRDALATDGPRSNAQVLLARRIVEAAAIARTEDHLAYSNFRDPRPEEVTHLRRLEEAGHELHKAETEWLAKADEEDDAGVCDDCGQHHETVADALACDEEGDSDA